MPPFRALVAIAISIAISACAIPPAASCKPGEQSAIQDTLYFGTAKPNGTVTAEEWANFLAATVTPRFPQGLTVSHASGQWRGADGSIVQESTRVLQLVHPNDARNEQSVTEVAAIYKSRFQQEAVLRVRTRTCVS
ncbi:DUF3574 domain-containing protein [Variovorax rhizosphaerae]|uniref:DUF3574 domain-containing protein n=1 Tax=Variovorax rhizosphaerae TaxID=1836200 RepID=A0ABU8WIZ4_9BURK